MKTLKLPDRHITVALHEQHWLYVYSGGTRQHIFSFVETVADFSLEDAPNSNHWLLWVLSIPGHLYRISEQTVTKSPKSGSATATVGKGNDSIFDDLLSNSSGLNFVQNTEPTSSIHPQDSLSQLTPFSTALCIFNDFIIVCSVANDVCTVNIYRKEDTSSVSEKNVTSTLVVPYFSKYVPMQNYDSQSCGKYMNLYLITSSDNSLVHCSQTIQLPSMVFSSLFGAEASILHSAVILLTMPSGCVYHFPLKQWTPQYNSVGCSLSILCNLNAPVVKVCFIHLQKQFDSDPQTETLSNSQLVAPTREFHYFPCLLLAAKNGKCFVFSSPNNFNNQLRVLETINLEDCPISDCCLGIKPHQLIYTTKRKIIQLHFVYNESIRQIHKQISSLSRISTLATLQLKDDNTLLCLSTHGQFHKLSISEEGFKMNTKLKQEEESIPQLFAQMENMSKKITIASEMLEAQSHIISQLVVGSHIMWRQFVSSNIQCKLTVDKDSYGKTILQCVLTNGKLTFSSDWSFLIEATTKQKCQQGSHTACHTFKTLSLANGLKPEESAKIDFTLDILAPSDTRICISAWLVFNLKSGMFYLDSPNETSKSLKTQLSKGLAIPIYKGNTDFLSFILPSERKEYKIHSISEINVPSLTSIVQKIACDKPIYKTFSDLHKDLSTESEQMLTYTIDIPPSLQTFLFSHSCTDPNHQSCLLKDLLSKMKVVMPCDVIGSESSITLRSSDCGDLVITVHQQDDAKYTLEIQAANQVAIAEAVQTILLRLKKLLPDKLAVILDCSKFLHESEIIKEELKSIQEDVDKIKILDNNIMTRLLYACLKLRNLDFMITSDLYS